MNGSDGGAGHAPAGSAGTTGGTSPGGGGASGINGAAGSGATTGNGGVGGLGAAGNGGASGNAGVSGNAGAAGHGAAGDGVSGGQAGGGAGAGGATSGGAGAGGATSGGAGAGGAGPGGAGGQAAHLVTFAFTGHVTSVSVAVDPTNDTTPRVGDTFTGSYTINANTPLQQGAFSEAEPGIAADLEIHNLSYSLPTPDERIYNVSYILIAPAPTACWIVVGYFAEPRTIPDFDDEAHMDLYWNLTNPTGPVPTAKDLTTVPPVLSDWTQGPAAVSIELKGTSHSDYVADGVIDTIVAE